MDYFVSIENTRYMRWQIALLLESMRKFGLQDKLLIAVCPGKGEKPIPHPRVFHHQNYGLQYGYSPINKPYAIAEALKAEVLNPNFVVIDPDMIMCRPILPNSDPVTAQNIWYMDHKYLVGTQGYLLSDWQVDPESWPDVGCVYQFNGVSANLFEDVCQYIVELLAPHREKKYTSRSAAWMKEMVAFSLALRNWPVKQTVEYQMPLSTLMKSENPKWNSCFIHYCNGVAPWFMKQAHNENYAVTTSPPDPFETIMNIPTYRRKGNELVPHFQKVVQSLVKRGNISWI